MKYPVVIITIPPLRLVKSDQYNYEIQEFKEVYNKKTKDSREDWCSYGFFSSIEKSLYCMREEYMTHKASKHGQWDIDLEKVFTEFDEKLIEALEKVEALNG